MHGRTAPVLLLALLVGVAPAWAQSIQTDDNIETDGQLVSNVAKGTAPLAVASTTKVHNLNSDRLDGLDSSFFTSLFLAAVEILDNSEPPCFNNTHRFVDCENGTVTDTVTGLIYLLDADCFGEQTWPTANLSAAALADGQCGLTDGSRAGDWRLQTKEEWEAILMISCTTGPKIVGNGSPTTGCYSDNAGANEWASGLGANGYWSSTTVPSFTTAVWLVKLDSTDVDDVYKTYSHHVWPVRGGQ